MEPAAELRQRSTFGLRYSVRYSPPSLPPTCVVPEDLHVRSTPSSECPPLCCISGATDAFTHTLIHLTWWCARMWCMTQGSLLSRSTTQQAGEKVPRRCASAGATGAYISAHYPQPCFTLDWTPYADIALCQCALSSDVGLTIVAVNAVDAVTGIHAVGGRRCRPHTHHGQPCIHSGPTPHRGA